MTTAKSPVMVAVSGGVDSAVAAAELRDAGHEVVGVTMKLWGGESDTGCCSVSDVLDARLACDVLGIEHQVFNFADAFSDRVVDPYVEAHAKGLTPNPCIECNRSIKFDLLLDRADELGFDIVATGHHARIVSEGSYRFVARGVDRAKDQSYVLHMLDQTDLRRVRFPIGHLTKDEVRARAAALGLRVATKPDSQDVCFISRRSGREPFLADRIALRPARVVSTDGRTLGEVPSVEMVTIGQRKGLGIGGSREPQFVVDVDPGNAVVTIGSRQDLLQERCSLRDLCWTAEPVEASLAFQTSAHGRPIPGRLVAEGPDSTGWEAIWDRPQRRVAPGQSVVAYRDDRVVAGAIAR